MNLYVNVNDQIPVYFSITSFPMENSNDCPVNIMTENIDLDIDEIRNRYSPEKVFDLMRRILNKLCTITNMELREIHIRDNLRLFSVTARGVHTIIYGIKLNYCFGMDDTDSDYIVFDRFIVDCCNVIRIKNRNPAYHGYMDLGSEELPNQIASLFTI